MTIQRAIVAMASVPSMVLVAGVLWPANRPKDAMPISTMCLLCPVLPALIIATVFAQRFVPTWWPSGLRPVRAAFLTLAALLVACDFCLIGVYGGAKLQHGVVSVPLASGLIAGALLQSRRPVPR